jgi:hypothetical protein
MLKLSDSRLAEMAHLSRPRAARVILVRSYTGNVNDFACGPFLSDVAARLAPNDGAILSIGQAHMVRFVGSLVALVSAFIF